MALNLLQRLSAISGRLGSFADQGFQGVANIVIKILIARGLIVEDFASIGLMLGIYYFFFGYHRVSVVLPFILDTSAETPDRNEVSIWWSASLYFTVVAEVVVLAICGVAYMVAVAAPNVLWVAHAWLYLAVALPTLLAGEFGRRMMYQTGRPKQAAAVSAMYLVAGVTVAYLADIKGSPMLAALSFSAAGLASIALSLYLIRPSIKGIREVFKHWRPFANFAGMQSITSTLYVLYNTSLVVLIATFAGAVTVAVYTAASTLVNPAFSMVSAVDSMDKPRAVRALSENGIPGLRRSLARTRRLLMVLTGGYLAVIAVFSPWLLATFFDQSYADHAGAMRMLTIGFFLMSINQPSETFLIALRDTKAILVVRIVGAAFAVLGIWLGASLGATIGVAIAIAVVQVVALVALKIAERVAARRWTLETADGPD